MGFQVSGEPWPYQELGDQQRRRAVQHTRADVWRTAAVMTCLLAPFGLLFGAVALWLMRGISAKIDCQSESQADAILRTARAIVLAGTGLGLVAALFALVTMASGALQLSYESLQVRQ